MPAIKRVPRLSRADLKKKALKKAKDTAASDKKTKGKGLFKSKPTAAKKKAKRSKRKA